MSSGESPDATLYVILGSHPCRTGMLLLEHKGIPYRAVHLPPGLHPLAVRLLGFPGHTEREVDDGRRTWGMRLGNRLGTVPALRIRGERVQTNRAIARHLDRIQPDPPLFPADPELRREVEAAESWGDQSFQMAARRIILGAAFDQRDEMRTGTSDGRLGPLLYRNPIVRDAFVRLVPGRAFKTTRATARRRVTEELPAMLDRIDAWVAAGVLNGPDLNAADYMIVTSLALITYREDLRPQIESRPLAALLDRVLPAPA